MDTGSEFAYMMAKLGGDILKDSSALLKEVVLLLYQNKSEREKRVLASGNFEKLAKAKEFSVITLKNEDVSELERLTKNTKLQFVVMPSGLEGFEEANIIYNKDQDEILNEVLLNIQKEKLEKISDERNENTEEIDEIDNDKEPKGINASLEEIRSEKAKEMAEKRENTNEVSDKKIKPKEKEMER